MPGPGKVFVSWFQFIPFPRLPLVRSGPWWRGIVFASLLAATVGILLADMRFGVLADWRQVASLSIFGGVIWGILLFEDYRLVVGLSAVAAILGLGLFTSVRQFVSATGLDVILFLLGTFLVAGYLEESLFFEHLAGQI